ncbi:hypothetical protein GCM10007108_02880 [Thermogymnomonas acidicola]|uniref:Uncharacterized protein n=1 Tax=Thermogymnomonas acidicola TaxID=399579 RepID=A0AA37BQ98_9ARCH|nr:hypothetical protein [Thermogymnomonas acidicola]GGM68235.1 hypothetical protein GCM10007108_02880 [Thermogymnomonas acidicola]
MPVITDGSFSAFSMGTIAATLALIVSILALYFVTARGGSPFMLAAGVAMSFIAYLIFTLYWGIFTRKVARANIVRQWPR